jgi:hypothetical protein
MKYDELVNSGRIRRQRISEIEIRRALDRAQRDLKTARRIMAEDWDWGFAVTYNAVLQASRGYMFAQGYRSVGAEGHKNTFAFMRLAMGKEYEDLITYDVAGIITQTEARSLFAKATDFVRLIRLRLTGRT